MMKLITAVIRKERLNYVLTELFENGIHGITVTQVKHHGRETEKDDTYRGLSLIHKS